MTDFERAVARASSLADAHSEVARKLDDLSILRRGLETRLENIDGPLREHQHARAKIGEYIASWRMAPGMWNGEQVREENATRAEVAPEVGKGYTSSRVFAQGASEEESAEADDLALEGEHLRYPSDEETQQWERAREQREAAEA